MNGRTAGQQLEAASSQMKDAHSAVRAAEAALTDAELRGEAALLAEVLVDVRLQIEALGARAD